MDLKVTPFRTIHTVKVHGISTLVAAASKFVSLSPQLPFVGVSLGNRSVTIVLQASSACICVPLLLSSCAFRYFRASAYPSQSTSILFSKTSKLSWWRSNVVLLLQNRPRRKYTCRCCYRCTANVNMSRSQRIFQASKKGSRWRKTI